MGRILGIDYGTKRTGLAATDPLQIIASPLETVPTNQLMVYLTQYLKKEVVDCIVVGYPKDLNNQPTDATLGVEKLVKELQKQFTTLPIHLIDERFTSKIAQSAILEAGKNKKFRENKANIDTVSATLILQSFLEQKNK